MDIATRIGKAGVELGVLKSATPKELTLEEAAQQWLGSMEKIQFAELGLGSRYVPRLYQGIPVLSLCEFKANEKSHLQRRY